MYEDLNSEIENILILSIIIFYYQEESIEKIIDMISKNSKDYVLKPQREGGGNNIYKEDIK